MVLPEFGVIKICLNLVLWRKVTRRKGEDGGLLKQTNGSHGGTVGAWSDGACLPILLAIYIQSVYPNRVIKNLYATPPSLFVPSAPPWHCVYLRSLRDSVCLLYKSFSLSLHISEEPNKSPFVFFLSVLLSFLLFCLYLSFCPSVFFRPSVL